MISQPIIDHLMALGRIDDIGSSESTRLLESLTTFERFYERHWSEWDSNFKLMNDDDVTALVQGLAVAEKALWGSGSVSPLIWAYMELVRRGPDVAFNAGEWIVRHNLDANYCVGYGNLRERVRIKDLQASIAEMERVSIKEWGELHWHERKQTWLQGEMRLIEQRRQQKNEEQERINALQERQERQRLLIQELEQLKQRNHVLNSYYLAKRREEIIESTRELDEASRLRIIAEEDEFGVGFFPMEWANVAEESLSSLEPDTIQLLMAKIQERKKGPWRQLYERLRGLNKPGSVA